MIAAHELRIGNIVLNQFTGEPCKITVMDISDIENGYKTREGFILSTEILEKCGFELYDEENKRWLFNSFYYYNDCVWFDTSQIEIKYLHQLQNLYYCLVGEELQVKL